MEANARGYDFSPVHQAMQRYVDANLLPGVSSAVLVGRDLVDVHCVGKADIERDIALRTDHLFRVFSNTKLVTSCAVLLLWEAGKFGLDDAIEQFIPQLGHRRVLRVGATSLTDTEPARSAITIRQLLSHSSGLSYGLLDPGTMMFNAYRERRVLNANATLADTMDTLAELPLAFHPGTGWEYSIATDVLARLIEVVSGERFDAFLQSHIFDPLGMVDTGFVIAPDQQYRLAAFYVGADPLDPMKPGLTCRENFPFFQANLREVAQLSGGGGLVSSLPDMVALLRSLLPGGETLLQPDTIAMMMTNQLPDGVRIRFPGQGEIRGKGFGLAGAVTLTPSSIDPRQSAHEFQWGGIGGTHWWISPRTNLAGLLMTQRQMAFWHPFSFAFKRKVYEAVLGR
jgi:CubicO group peptidase (beta-lactamase class C family)